MTSAYNVALYVADFPNGDPGYALWTIWPAWTSNMLEEYILNNSLASSLDGNPIHGQKVYLDEGHISAFTEQYKVKPYVIRQQQGDTIFIPANSPHQVL